MNVVDMKFISCVKKIPSQYLLIGLLSMLATAGVATGVYFFRQSAQRTPIIPGSTNEIHSEVAGIVTQVGKFMSLPAGTPMVATITDITKLSGQPFFKNAANGDKVLVYEDTRKAILYRPSTNMIIDVATITLGRTAGTDQTTQLQAPTAGPTPIPIRVAIRNGTTTLGLSQKLENELKAKRGNVTVTEKDNAKDTDWRSTVMVDVTGKNSTVLSEISQLINARVVSMPEGEQTPKADILIIIGADRK